MRALLAACLLALAIAGPAGAEIGGAIQPPPQTDIVWTPTETRTAWGGERLAREFNGLPDRKKQVAYIVYLSGVKGRALLPFAWAARQRRPTRVRASR